MDSRDLLEELAARDDVWTSVSRRLAKFSAFEDMGSDFRLVICLRVHVTHSVRVSMRVTIPGKT